VGSHSFMCNNAKSPQHHILQDHSFSFLIFFFTIIILYRLNFRILRLSLSLAIESEGVP